MKQSFIGKNARYYLRYFFAGQIFLGLFAIILISLGDSLSIPVHQKTNFTDASIQIGTASLTNTIQAGDLSITDSNFFQKLLLTQIPYLPFAKDFATALMCIITGILMLRFTNKISKTSNFGMELSLLMRWMAVTLTTYMMLSLVISYFRWNLVEKVSGNQFLPADRLSDPCIRYAWIVAIVLFLFSTMLKQAYQMQKEQDLTI
jgi:uncharacterized membrane protein (DUF485 family)